MPEAVLDESRSGERAQTLATKPLPVDSKFGSIRVNWQLKAIAPVALVLLAGLMLFILATVSLRDPQRHAVLVLAGGGAIAVCATLIFVLAWFVQRPMVELQEKMTRLGEGDLNVSVSFAKRNDEIGSLGRNFNQMVAQLRESRYEIEHMHQTQISRAEYFATLGELAAGLAHEIRNPLAGIAGVVEVIARDLPAKSPARAVVKDVRVEIAQINRILTDLLQTVRPHPPEMHCRDLNATVEDAVNKARQQALSKPIEIVLRKHPVLPEIEYDSNQIHQALMNLLLNAIQAIEGQGRITVETEAGARGASISVSDTGRGIPPKHLANIFRPFYTTKGAGTGLGLSFARRIVEEHQGHIDVTSAVGKGTTFVVSLPLSRPTTQQEVS
jgi:signal transduction histidine kinase